MSTNEVIHKEEHFYISYLESRSDFSRACDELCALLGRPEPKDLPETALVLKDGSGPLTGKRFLILYGDHRAAYSGLSFNLEKCLDYFRNNLDQIGHSSDLPPEADRAS